MKTIFIYNDTANPLQFFIKDGDYSHLDGCYINGTWYGRKISDAEWDEINSLLYVTGKDGWVVLNPDIEFLDKFPTEQVDANTKVVVIGFYA